MALGTAIQSSVEGIDDLPGDQIDELPGDDGNDGNAAYEARAREMGWKPLAEYRGPPGRWQPAKDFIERGENILPIVRDQNRRLTERVGKLESEISGLRVTAEEQLQIIKEQRQRSLTADQRGYDRAMAEIKANQRKAVEAGDTIAYDQLVEQAEALQGSRPEPVAAVAPKTPDPEKPAVSAAVQSFIGQNPWMYKDQFLTRKMIDAHIDVIQEAEITDEGEQLTEAKQRVVDAYPGRFGVERVPPVPKPRLSEPPPRPRRAAAVASPTVGDLPRGNGQAMTIASIADPADRAEAREAFNRTKRQIPDYTEAEYMALYADPHSDVLTIQKPRK